MTQIEITNAIKAAMDNLYNWNQALLDYWISELYDECDNEIAERWNEDTLWLMEKDVEYSCPDSLSV